MTPANAATGGAIGKPLDRVDGPLKVCGAARYAAEFFPPNPAYAVLVQSTVPAGTVKINVDEAKAMPGVIAILTHDNAPELPQKGKAAVNPPAGRTLSLLQDDEVHYNGEPIAVVVADSLEIATDAATRLKIDYATRPAKLRFADAKAAAYKPTKLTRDEPDRAWGDVDAGERGAAVRIDHVYTTPMEHHNPLEPHATVAHWTGDQLTLYDATQYVSGVKETVAKTLGIPGDAIRVVDPYVGGGFGCKGSSWSHVVLCALAAKAARRPVKLVVARWQMFGPVGGRPQTEQRVRLAARQDGRLTAIRHDVISHTSFMEDYAEGASAPTRAMYACDNGAVTQRLVQLNVGVPTFMRAPGEATGSFALESAMDELAYELGIDPLALRLVNHADKEPSSGKPWSSKKLRQCYEVAARRFGWSKRNPRVGSMRDGRELVGYGMATASYPAHRLPASASARLMRDGTLLVQSGTQDLGTGTYTIMTQIAAETLGVPVERVRFELGDTLLPKAPVSGGSMTAASVGPAVQAACQALRDKVIAAAIADAQSPLFRRAAAEVTLRDGMLIGPDGRREAIAAVVARQPDALEAKADAKPDEATDKKYATRSFGAVFAEVRVDPLTGVLRVPRVVAAYNVGRLMNLKTAKSQLEGGIVWGLGMALFEESILDERTGRFVNGNLAEYHVPVNADVHAIDVSFVDENDTIFNPLGARGIGEIGITGVAAALANAAYHATGKRVRELPITLDKLL
jgi:xanthine dehydrogenase YagR molybdenum-binding subunit